MQHVQTAHNVYNFTDQQINTECYNFTERLLGIRLYNSMPMTKVTNKIRCDTYLLTLAMLANQIYIHMYSMYACLQRCKNFT